MLFHDQLILRCELKVREKINEISFMELQNKTGAPLIESDIKELSPPVL